MTALTPSIFADCVRLPGRWANSVRINIDAGSISAITVGTAPQAADHRVSLLLPGMCDAHSHAFQRALAGRTEVAAADDDDFWSWRESMYRFLQILTPDDVEAIAAQLYVEKLQAGVTSLVEFHYLHHDLDGSPYARRTEMSERVIAAARAAGVALTLLPVLYTYRGFDRGALGPAQRRFATSVDQVAGLLRDLAPVAAATAEQEAVTLGAAPHSLRASDVAQIRALVNSAPTNGPFHIHAAEQTREVDECVAATGHRPVRLLLDSVGLDSRWCVVHATHVEADEVRDLAASGAAVALCPSTEADLGDGIFPFAEYAGAGGAWAIGGDSHVCRSPVEELRLLEYSQRLRERRRNRASAVPGQPIADALWDAAARGGARAAARFAGAIEPGRRADLVAFEIIDAAAAAYAPSAWLSQAVFGGARARVADVWVGGRHVLQDGVHAKTDVIADRYAATLHRLLA